MRRELPADAHGAAGSRRRGRIPQRDPGDLFGRSARVRPGRRLDGPRVPRHSQEGRQTRAGGRDRCGGLGADAQKEKLTIRTMSYVLSIVLVVFTWQQVPPPPPPPPQRPPGAVRDAATPEKKGTAVLKGHVRTADGRPLRRARISVRGAALSSARSASTGLEGEYEVTELPAGRFTVSATRGGYLAAQYGQRAYGDDGTPIEVADAATLDKIDLTMERAGTVSGRLTDEAGEAVSGATVWLQQMQFFHGRKQYVEQTSAQTDDTGLYRISSVPPGEFVLFATFRETWTADDKPAQTLGYAPTYFPGSANPIEAQRIKVTAGHETGGIDFS